MMRRQRVVVSAAFLVTERMTGVERYSAELVRALHDRCPPGRELVVAAPRWLGGSAGIEVHAPPRSWPRPLVNEAWLPWLARYCDADVVHTLSYGAPGALRRPWIATIHDLVPWERPRTLGRAGRWYLGPSMRLTLRHKHPDAVITLAPSTARALVARTRPGTRIVTIPNGVGARFTPAAPPADGPPWRLLSVGTVEPRKGMSTLAQAVTLLRQRGLKVVAQVVGRPGWGDPLPEALIALGPLSDDDLVAAYRDAHLLVAPSEAEGFDLPALEAMASGLPVVASDIPVHRDHFCGAAELFPVRDAVALSDAVAELVASPGQRQRMRAAGLETAGRYSWAAAADAVHSLYDEITTRR